MKNESNITTIEACRKALERCPHAKGTVSVTCRVCLGSGGVFAYDFDRGEFLSIDCPRCAERLGTGETGVPEVCPCLEPFDKEIVARVIEIEKHGKPDGEEKGDPSPLSEALKWAHDRAPGVPLEGASAAEPLRRLRTWAEEHREVTIPHPKAALILDLLDHGMIEFETVPETGKLAFRAISAKEEFCRFIAALKRRYAYDESTILEMLNFAYGTDKWEFDPVHLEKYARVKETLEIRTSALKVHSENGLLCGKREDIEAIILSVL
jgi:hypothetical protein